jgi:hypothetical protein
MPVTRHFMFPGLNGNDVPERSGRTVFVARGNTGLSGAAEFRR